MGQVLVVEHDPDFAGDKKTGSNRIFQAAKGGSTPCYLQ